MTKEFIEDSMGLHVEWYERARKIETKEQLMNFIEGLMTKYSHDSFTVVHAINAGALATVHFMNKYPEGGLGKSQQQKLLGQFIRTYGMVDGPLKLVNWFGMLNPDNEWAFTTIPKSSYDQVVSAAKEMLAGDMSKVKPSHVDHIIKIANGYIPFGYKIGESK